MFFVGSQGDLPASSSLCQPLNAPWFVTAAASGPWLSHGSLLLRSILVLNLYRSKQAFFLLKQCSKISQHKTWYHSHFECETREYLVHPLHLATNLQNLLHAAQPKVSGPKPHHLHISSPSHSLGHHRSTSGGSQPTALGTWHQWKRTVPALSSVDHSCEADIVKLLLFFLPLKAK